MLVSIIVPAYNAQAFLASTIESILNQAYREWELTIVDDGSTDRTPDIALAYAQREQRVRVVHQANAGAASARNRGTSECHAATTYLAFLDADDTWQPDALQRLTAKLETAPGAVAVNGLSRFIDAEGRSIHPGVLETWGRRREGVVGRRLIDWPLGWPTTLSVLAFRNSIQTPGQVLIRRTALQAVGDFDPDAAPCEDWDLWLRLSQQGDITFLDRVVLNYRRHNHNVSADLDKVVAGERYLRGKIIRGSAARTQQREVVLSANRHWARRVCARRMQSAGGHLIRGRWARACQEALRAVTSYSRCRWGHRPV